MGNTMDDFNPQAGPDAWPGTKNRRQPASEAREEIPNTMDVARDLIDAVASGLVRSAPADIPRQAEAMVDPQVPRIRSADDGLGL